jgi:signal peptidase II
VSGAALAWARLVAVAGAVFALDQVAKAIAVASLVRGESVNVFFGIDLTHVRNTGVAFGVLSGAGTPLLAVIGVALLALLVFFARRASTPWMWLPVGTVLGGALGNLIDRAREGTVIDWIDPIFWPAFNLADAAIVVGVLGILYVAEGPRDADDAERSATTGARG